MAQPFPKHPNLTGGFAPIQMECDVRDVVVVGEVPSDLNGSFYRNGPNPQFAPVAFITGLLVTAWCMPSISKTVESAIAIVGCKPSNGY